VGLHHRRANTLLLNKDIRNNTALLLLPRHTRATSTASSNNLILLSHIRLNNTLHSNSSSRMGSPLLNRTGNRTELPRNTDNSNRDTVPRLRNRSMAGNNLTEHHLHSSLATFPRHQRHSVTLR